MRMLTVPTLVYAMLALTPAAAVSHLVKRSASCSGRWSEVSGRCFQYIPRSLSWARAERNCESLGGNLASVHNIMEYQEIQRLIMTASYGYKETWIGGSDAQEENQWLWSDGTPFIYVNWCPGEPNNHMGEQHCLRINHAAQKCWDDFQCHTPKPSVCAKKI
ncbi:ladderlectin-like isoform X1 [Amphiprion ocellaris]|uniref:C-type lectin domain-containing protein n=1 Tax=Amphiprion ocellaris TaxID=80972 RepID=A0A3Q1BRR7_AMPOC|nr:ladderlectin-like isoform X1 [Amphiprion ocellaris]